jgi:hypothetical protein
MKADVPRKLRKEWVYANLKKSELFHKKEASL